MVGGPGHTLLTVDLVAEPSDTKSSGFEPNGSSGVSLVVERGWLLSAREQQGGFKRQRR